MESEKSPKPVFSVRLSAEQAAIVHTIKERWGAATDREVLDILMGYMCEFLRRHPNDDEKDQS